MVLVDLGVRPKFDLAVFIKINTQPRDNVPGAEDVRYPVGMWEGIQPKCAVIDELNNHARRESLKRQSVVDCPGAFLQSTYMSLDFGHVIIVSAGFQGNVEVGEFTTEGLKLPIHDAVHDSEAALSIEIAHLFNRIEEGRSLLVGDHFGRTES